jgi:hypothetical protein
MTLTTLITLNATLGAAVVYGLLLLLTHGIRSDHAARRADVGASAQLEPDRLAA